ncbi:hypothetical protein N431DRAFT_446702 [Stipitochalara longipes BDJ]|nr:hypothetical protein N431DRAFT_446702 [Stipitochalara longipes BDJ]
MLGLPTNTAFSTFQGRELTGAEAANLQGIDLGIDSFCKEIIADRGRDCQVGLNLIQRVLLVVGSPTPKCHARVNEFCLLWAVLGDRWFPSRFVYLESGSRLLSTMCSYLANVRNNHRRQPQSSILRRCWEYIQFRQSVRLPFSIGMSRRALQYLRQDALKSLDFLFKN